jgi:hypothetical protein
VHCRKTIDWFTSKVTCFALLLQLIWLVLV